jgi:hypothetical protein
MLDDRRIDPVSFNQVVTGFTVAFGASAFGYVAFLCSRIQQEIVDDYSADLAMLLENDMSEAVTRAFAPLAAITTPNGTITDLSVIAEAVRSVADASDTLRETLERAGQTVGDFANLLRDGRADWENAANIWRQASQDFATEAATAADRIQAAAAAVGGTAGAITTAANQMVTSATVITEHVNRAVAEGVNSLIEQTTGQVQRLAAVVEAGAQRVSDQLEQGAQTVNRTIQDGLNDLLARTNNHVTQFNDTLEQFRAHIRAQLEDFREAHADTTLGRQQLHAALVEGQEQVRAFELEMRQIINGLAAAELELSASVRDADRALRAPIAEIGSFSRDTADRMATVQQQLEQLIRIATGVST